MQWLHTLSNCGCDSLVWITLESQMQAAWFMDSNWVAVVKGKAQSRQVGRFLNSNLVASQLQRGRSGGSRKLFTAETPGKKNKCAAPLQGELWRGGGGEGGHRGALAFHGGALPYPMAMALLLNPNIWKTMEIWHFVREKVCNKRWVTDSEGLDCSWGCEGKRRGV